MHYRLKLLLATCALALVSAGIVFALVYRVAERAQFAQIQATVKAIAAAVAGEIDGDRLNEIEAEGDAASLEIGARLRAARDLQRAAGLGIEFIYVMRPGPDGGWIYVADGEEEAEKKSSFGDPFVFAVEDKGDAVLKMELVGEAEADNAFTSDQYGYWLSADAPVRNSAGEVVARLGVDMRADEVRAKQRRLFTAALGGFIAALVAGVVLALLIGTWASAPLHRIGIALGKIGDGELDTRIEVRSADEFGRLEKAVNTMAESLQQRRELKGSLSRYVSRDIAHELVHATGEPEFDADADTRDITVLFCNIDQFEQLDDRLSNEEIVGVLNAFFSRTVAVVFQNGGTLDRFYGAGVMATFGCYGSGTSHPDEAIRAARSIATAMRGISDRIPDVELRVRIGLHTGEARVARTSEDEGERMAFKAIGGAVDTAALVMGEACEQSVEILATTKTIEGTEGEFATKPSGDVFDGGVQLELVSIV